MSMIEHIVISGGGASGLYTVGAITELKKAGVICHNRIRSIYATSVGTIIAVCLALDIDWDIVSMYISNRPWHNAFALTMDAFAGAYTNKGIYGRDMFVEIMRPLFLSVDISVDITILELFAKTGIDIHMFSFELNEFKTHDIHSGTCPQLTVIDAIWMSCAIPSLISPRCVDGRCFSDGGCFANYPLNECLATGVDANTVLGFTHKYESLGASIDDASNITSYMLTYVRKMAEYATARVSPSIANEIVCPSPFMTLALLHEAIYSSEMRSQWIANGENIAKQWLLSRTQVSEVLTDNHISGRDLSCSETSAIDPA